ncbi:hypothetical protein GWI33_000717 [Rhynchophorus ferrugineus]|uniref:Uncharacterized protein n=1 Tax=Rhynchophorus ferrugineus TaxID=354439 RepID=A0A834INU0_RHYFE|nr:hypothetical protein GWI33_000717 [Rhynchophorus ferrugineus]
MFNSWGFKLKGRNKRTTSDPGHLDSENRGKQQILQSLAENSTLPPPGPGTTPRSTPLVVGRSFSGRESGGRTLSTGKSAGILSHTDDVTGGGT